MSSSRSRYPNFSDSEFRQAIPPCHLSDMDDAFMKRLQVARDLAGVPFVINSAFRNVTHEKSLNRSGNSMHCLGRAVDLRCKDSKTRYIILKAIIEAGFTGIGIASTFIHVDDRSDPLIWLY